MSTAITSGNGLVFSHDRVSDHWSEIATNDNRLTPLKACQPSGGLTCDPDVDVEEAALDHLEGEAQFGASGDFVEEAFLCVSVDHQEIGVQSVE